MPTEHEAANVLRAALCHQRDYARTSNEVMRRWMTVVADAAETAPELLEVLAELLGEDSDKTELARIATRVRASALIARVRGDGGTS